MDSESRQYLDRRVINHGGHSATPAESESIRTSDTPDQNSPLEPYNENVPMHLRQFQFIDERYQDTPDRKTQKRKHVMQEHLRQRRWQTSVRKDSVLSRRATEASTLDEATPSSSDSPQRQPDEKSDDVALENSPRTASSYSLALSHRANTENSGIVSEYPFSSPQATTDPNTRQRVVMDFPHGSNLVERRSTSPRSDPSPTAIDPFSQIPSGSAVPWKDQELVHFYASDTSSTHYRPSNIRAFNWARENIIKQALNGPLAMSAVASLASAKLAALQGKKDDPLLNTYHARAISVLHHHLRNNPTDASDDVVASVMIQAMLDYYLTSTDRQNSAMLHWRAAVSIIRNRGGPATLENNRQLRLLLLWWDYTFHSYQSNDWNFHFTKDPSSLQIGDPYHYIYESCEELLLFLRNVEHLALVQKSMPKQRAPCRKTAFKPDAALHTMLSAPARSSPRDLYLTSFRSRAVSRLASLLSINAAIWDYRNHPAELTERYLKTLGAKIVETDLDIRPCPDTLCQILIDGIYLADQGTDLREREEARPWVVGRFVKVARRLGRRSWERLGAMLFGFLTLDEREGFKPAAFGLEDALRREVLAAPLECMQPLFLGP